TFRDLVHSLSSTSSGPLASSPICSFTLRLLTTAGVTTSETPIQVNVEKQTAWVSRPSFMSLGGGRTNHPSKGSEFTSSFCTCQVGIALVGIGSFLFHATLRYEWQLGDELPMIFAGAMSAYVHLTPAVQIYHEVDFLHQTAFAAISLKKNASSISVIHTPTDLFWSALDSELPPLGLSTSLFQLRKNLSREEEQVRWDTIFIRRNIMFIIGFLIWNIDNLYCDRISQLKEYLGTPWSFIIEGHAWWHLATGTGTYLPEPYPAINVLFFNSNQNAVGTQLMSLSLKEGSEGFEIKRGGIFGLCPYVARISSRIDSKLQHHGTSARAPCHSLVVEPTARRRLLGSPRSQLCDQQIYRGIYKYSIKLYFCGIKKCRDQDLPLPLVLGQVPCHSTLRMAIGDELPMIFSGALGVYIAFDTCSSNQQRTRFVRCLPYLLSMYAFGVTAVYLWYPNPVFHQIAFAAISLINTSRSAYLALSAPGGTYQEQKNRTDGIRYTFGGTIIFLAGFLIWNIDNVYCDQISQLKEYLGAPWSFILEGHAWWHLATGTGAYLVRPLPFRNLISHGITNVGTSLNRNLPSTFFLSRNQSGLRGGQLITLSLKEGAEGFEIRRGGIFGLCPYVARTSSRIPSKLQ
ncbi:hypothetical protein PSTT_07015, partial [Puccinia striiformis]